MSKIPLNIQPQAYDVYAMFMRLTNTEPFALGEFIDNSSASFYENKDKLSDTPKLFVNINYEKKTHTIKIEDNAYGMDLPNFKRAIMVGSKTDKVGSRNEFGKGLKTAATWFGSKWTVESTQLGESKCYCATVDVNELLEKKLNSIDITEIEAKSEDHYTIITLENLNHDLNTAKIQKEVIEKLGSIYRRDIINDTIEINFNGKKVTFENNPILEINNEKMYKDLDFTIDFNGKTYRTKGYAALSSEEAKVGATRTGFALFRVNRAIKINEKPYEIFGNTPNSPLGFKLFGELDMDDFEVNQAKDGLAWSPELRELFYTTLKSNIQKIYSIGILTWPKIRALSKPQTPPVTPVPPTPPVPPIKPEPPKTPTPPTTPVTPTPTVSPTTPVPPTAQIPQTDFNIKIKDKEFTVKIENLNNSFLYKFEEKDNLLILNNKHSYITKSLDSNKEAIAQIILAYVLAENEARKRNADGYIIPADIHLAFSNYLQDLTRN